MFITLTPLLANVEPVLITLLTTEFLRKQVNSFFYPSLVHNQSFKEKGDVRFRKNNVWITGLDLRLHI